MEDRLNLTRTESYRKMPKTSRSLLALMPKWVVFQGI
jgi:hypothetical protein